MAAAKRLRKNFTFSGNATLAASVGAAGQIIFTVESDRKFMLEAVMYRAVTTTADNISLFSIQISRDSEKLFSDYVPCDAFGGNIYYNNAGTLSLKVQLSSGQPVYFKKPYPFNPKSNIKVDLKNDYALAQTVYIMLVGHYIYI